MTRSIGSLSFAAEDGRQLLALDERHGDELDAVDLAELVNADDVLVRDLARQQELLLEAALEHRGRRGVRGHFRPDHLERDDDAELGVPRLVDGPHAADAEQADDVIAGAEWLPGSQRAGWPVGPVAGAAACRAGSRRDRRRHRAPAVSRCLRCLEPVVGEGSSPRRSAHQATLLPQHILRPVIPAAVDGLASSARVHTPSGAWF